MGRARTSPSDDPAYRKRYLDTHPEYAAKARDRARSWGQSHKAGIREYWKRKREANPDKAADRSRRARLKHRYNLSVEQYEGMLATQGGVCAICGRPPRRNRLAVDHCHATGRIRGLLCSPCNRFLGHLRDSPALLKRAAKYLLKETRSELVENRPRQGCLFPEPGYLANVSTRAARGASTA
jgi:hypothetical protein